MHRNAMGFAALVVSMLLLCSLVLLSPGCSKDKKGEGEVATGTGTGQRVQDTRVAVKVNGDAISEDAVDREMMTMMMQMGGRPNPQQMEAMKTALRPQALDMLVGRKLLEQQVKKEGISVATSDVDARVGEIKKQFASEEAFSQRLAAAGMTEAGFRRDIETQIAVEALVARHTPEVKSPTEADIKAYYEENPERFKEPERVKASHILVAVPKDATEAQRAEKRQMASKLLSDVRGGADFAQTASQYSDCPSKEQGGDLGYFPKGRMVKPFENAAFSLRPGEISDIVETEFGYHIIKVADHAAVRDVPFEEARQQIAAMLEGQDRGAAVGTYVESLRATAKIEYPDTTKQ